ncbi:MAG TPA: hypothetical protein VIU41_05530 [Geobacteraceae bacterium]
MRLLAVVCTALLLSIGVSVATAAEMDGFRGLKWGSEPAALSIFGQKKVEGHMGAVPGVQAYQLNNDDLVFGGVKATSIVYAFFKGRFTSVSIDFVGFDNFEKMQAYCKQLFGPVTNSATMKQEHYVSFDGPKTGALLLYQFSMGYNSYGRLYLYSKEYLQ